MGNTTKSQKGFNLLEIFVVFFVITGILVITGFSYISSQKRERDSQRKADLKMISHALDQYFDTCGYVFPPEIPNSGSFSCPQPNKKTYITEMPRDPQTHSPYTYSAENNNTIYTVCTNNMETAAVTKFCISNK